MAQQTLPLRTFGYVEPNVSSPSYPYLPVCTGYVNSHGLLAHDGDTCPTHEHPGIDVDALARRAGGFAWLRAMTNAYGHCAQ